MATDPQRSNGGQPPENEQPLQQPTDAVAMDDINTKTAAAPEGGLSIPVPPKDIDPLALPDSATADAETSAKGKDKDDSKQKEDDDSLSIEPTDPQPAAASNSDPVVCTITLLLPTGARHPYRIDEKYLAKRNVEIPDVSEAGGKDPFSISVYKLKELILREWREEWEGKPASPSSIRLIFFGKLLDDKEQLKSRFHLDHTSS